MSGKPKSRAGKGRKCKAKPDPPARPAVDAPRFSRPWMEVFIAAALSTADVDRGLAAAGVELGDYLRGRRLDLAFDLECRELDLVLRLAIQQSVTSLAARGDRQAAKMVARGELEMRRDLAAADPAGQLPAPFDRLARELARDDVPDWLAAAVERFWSALTIRPAELGIDDLAEWSGWTGEDWARWARVAAAELRAESTGVFPLWLVRAMGFEFANATGRGYGVVIVNDDGRPVAYTDRNGRRITTGRERLEDANPALMMAFPLGPDDDGGDDAWPT